MDLFISRSSGPTFCCRSPRCAHNNPHSKQGSTSQGEGDSAPQIATATVRDSVGSEGEEGGKGETSDSDGDSGSVSTRLDRSSPLPMTLLSASGSSSWPGHSLTSAADTVADASDRFSRLTPSVSSEIVVEQQRATARIATTAAAAAAISPTPTGVNDVIVVGDRANRCLRRGSDMDGVGLLVEPCAASLVVPTFGIGAAAAGTSGVDGGVRLLIAESKEEEQCIEEKVPEPVDNNSEAEDCKSDRATVVLGAADDIDVDDYSGRLENCKGGEEGDGDVTRQHQQQRQVGEGEGKCDESSREVGTGTTSASVVAINHSSSSRSSNSNSPTGNDNSGEGSTTNQRTDEKKEKEEEEEEEEDNNNEDTEEAAWPLLQLPLSAWRRITATTNVAATTAAAENRSESPSPSTVQASPDVPEEPQNQEHNRAELLPPPTGLDGVTHPQQSVAKAETSVGASVLDGSAADCEVDPTGCGGGDGDAIANEEVLRQDTARETAETNANGRADDGGGGDGRADEGSATETTFSAAAAAAVATSISADSRVAMAQLPAPDNTTAGTRSTTVSPSHAPAPAPTSSVSERPVSGTGVEPAGTAAAAAEAAARAAEEDDEALFAEAMSSAASVLQWTLSPFRPALASAAAAAAAVGEGRGGERADGRERSEGREVRVDGGPNSPSGGGLEDVGSWLESTMDADAGVYVYERLRLRERKRQRHLVLWGDGWFRNRALFCAVSPCSYVLNGGSMLIYFVSFYEKECTEMFGL